MDASFVLGSSVPSAISRAVLARWNNIGDMDEVVAPPLLLAECTPVVVGYAYRKELTESRARAIVGLLVQLPVRLVDAAALYPRAFDIARVLGWAKAYDALYPAAAEAEAAELLTVDRRMSDAADRLGIRATLVAAVDRRMSDAADRLGIRATLVAE